MFKKRVIFRGLFSIIAITAVFTGTLQAAPRLIIKDFDNKIDFTNQKVLLIQKGDNSRYKEPGYDDSGWEPVTVPSNWNKLYPEWTGICWYRLHIAFPEQLPHKSLGIRLGIIIDVDEVYFNGKLIGKSGTFPPLQQSSYDKKRVYEIPTALIKPGEDNILAIRVAGIFPYANGLIKGKFCIASMQSLQKNYLVKEFSDLFFIIFYLGVSIYFGLFFLKGTTGKEFLYFSLLSLSSAIYLFLRTQIKYFISDDFLLLKRIEYPFLILTFSCAMEFFTFYFKKRHTIIHYAYYSIAAICLLLVFFTNDFVFWHYILHYIIQPSWIIPGFYFLYTLLYESKRTKEARYILGSLGLLALAAINDLMVSRFLYNFVRISHYAFAFVILGITIIMRNRFVSLYQEVRDLKKKEEQHQNNKKKTQKTAITSYSKDRIEEALSIIHEKYNTDISREDIARMIGFNPDHLGKVFKGYTGKKISDYINEVRVKDAAEQLLKTDETIIKIAYSVGFESLSTFYRVFQKVVGESPSNYREGNKVIGGPGGPGNQ
ncbi:MAG: helix-turn-helix transcriptional regulator [bacterium]|nr:helix-turn-helix transcriptional regulator [bacterium]